MPRLKQLPPGGANPVPQNAASTAAVIRGRAALGWLAKLGLPSRLVDATGVVFTVAGWPDEPVPVRSEIAQK